MQADPVVVTATRIEQKSFDLPMSIDAVDAAAIQDQQLRVNISESLGPVPGLVANNRYNYAQDIQISIRGFGARASFGVRGVKLYQDGIPFTMPDGQGQTGSFALDTAKRIEVLRGPFAALYGNASGGVIQLFTQDGPPQPTLSAGFAFGSYGTWRANAQFGGQAGRLNYIADASRFMTDGYRDHSAAERNLGNLKLTYAPDADSTLTVLATTQNQPDSQDPLGLTAQQLQQNPRQAGAGAELFNTRKSVGQTQGGLAYQRRVTGKDTISAIAYGGHRDVNQYLAFTGAAPTSSGGVVDLDRDFYGGSLQWNRATELAGGPLTFTLGLDYSNMAEDRQGFVNNFGVQGPQRRNERDTVYAFDQYLQFQWEFATRWQLSGGVRHTYVPFKVQDNFVTAANPDDSGSINYSGTSPVLGLLYKVTDTVNVYGAVGRGFETPTFAEIAYRPDGQPGVNFSLQPAISTNSEIGVKAYLGANTRANLALFYIDTEDDIVNGPQIQPGRNTFVNAAKTNRQGAELAVDSVLGAGFSTLVAFTWLDAQFKDFSAGGVSFSGNRIPGVPATSAYAELGWAYAPLGFSTALSGRWASRVYTDDANSSYAAAYTVFNWRAGFQQTGRGWRLAEFVQVNNLTDKQYVGSVIVNAANAQFFEPSPTRNWLVGINASFAF
ncbi:MAG TPA: TonB-dependent receptor [Burkholderiales bacterium]|nr:TonB-dependent receptor [Burkholderiales bacterium]